MKLTEENINYITEKVIDIVESTRKEREAKRAVKGNDSKIRTIAILTAENPMGDKLSNDENRDRMAKLKTYLKDRHYLYFRGVGKYGNEENSLLIYNISLDDTLHIGGMFKQESVIFIKKKEHGKMLYQYWEQNGDGNFKLLHERDKFIDVTDADDLFTRISREFKFKIPFFDGSDKNKEIMKEHILYINKLVASKNLTPMNEERYLNNILDDSKTGRCKYESRGILYGRK